MFTTATHFEKKWEVARILIFKFRGSIICLFFTSNFVGLSYCWFKLDMDSSGDCSRPMHLGRDRTLYLSRKTWFTSDSTEDGIWVVWMWLKRILTLKGDGISVGLVLIQLLWLVKLTTYLLVWSNPNLWNRNSAEQW